MMWLWCWAGVALVIAPVTAKSMSVQETNVTASFPSDELNILYEFYNATNGDEWAWSAYFEEGAHWNFTPNANPCVEMWEGINCTIPLAGESYHVTEISIFSANVSGTLPDSLYQLRNLTTLSLRFNRINGTIPASYGNFENLQYLVLNGNRLSGRIPPSLGNITSLVHLDIFTNEFSGTIPSTLCQLTNLVNLDLKVNFLTGPIPNCIGNLTLLNYFNLHTNTITGTIPESVGSLVNLQNFDLGANEIRGHLPPSLSNLLSLTQLFFDVNQISGTIPPILGQMLPLQAFYIDINRITGTIPPELGQLANLTDFYVDYNLLTGTVPTELSGLVQLQYLFINNNHLHGVLPESIGTLQDLQYIVVHNNALSGTIPTTYANLHELVLLQLQFNCFSGVISGRFNPALHTKLASIQINDNQFTGTLPAEIFELRALNTFVAVSNCFSGTLPSTVCGANNMVSLILDGLSSASVCREIIFPGISASYQVSNPLSGAIPDCLFALHNLSTLHLSGNGFSGHLPAIAIDSNLNDLSISHNMLSGTIPVAIQERQWLNLDLSYNKLTGSLDSQFASVHVNYTNIVDLTLAYRALHLINTLLGYNILTKSFQDFRSIFGTVYARDVRTPSVSVENNRLSGVIPASINPMTDVSVLSGNLFSCDLDQSDLPEHDKNRNTYQCGSTAFNLPYYVWLGFMVLFVVAVVVVAYNYRNSNVVKVVEQWYSMISSGDLSNAYGIQSFFEYQRILCATTMWCTVYILLVLIPLYAVLDHYYATITHQYAWSVSAGYLSGRTALACIFAFLMVLLTLMGAYLKYRIVHVQFKVVRTESVSAAYSNMKYAYVHWRRVLIASVYVWTNVVVVVGVNALFVYTAIYANSALLFIAQVLITLFKIIWNNICVTHLLRVIVQVIDSASVKDKIAYAENDIFVALKIFVSLLNYIVLPCFVVGVISPDCFYHVFSPPPEVTSSYTYQQCVYNNYGVCDLYLPIISSTSYNPPFRYSFQCSSSMITYYAPAFVILCLVTTIANPLVQLCAMYTHSRVEPGSRVHRALVACVPCILLPPPAEEAPKLTFVDPNREMIRLISFLGLLLTFGAVFPPLAAALFVTMVALALFTRLKIGRFLHTAREQNQPQYVNIIDKECQTVGSVSVLHRTVYILISMCCAFYTLFLFDTLGDAVGFYGAYWLLIVVPLMPVIIYFVLKVWMYSVGMHDGACASGANISNNSVCAIGDDTKSNGMSCGVRNGTHNKSGADEWDEIELRESSMVKGSVMSPLQS